MPARGPASLAMPARPARYRSRRGRSASGPDFEYWQLPLCQRCIDGAMAKSKFLGEILNREQPKSRNVPPCQPHSLGILTTVQLAKLCVTPCQEHQSLAEEIRGLVLRQAKVKGTKRALSTRSTTPPEPRAVSRSGPKASALCSR